MTLENKAKNLIVHGNRYVRFSIVFLRQPTKVIFFPIGFVCTKEKPPQMNGRRDNFHVCVFYLVTRHSVNAAVDMTQIQYTNKETKQKEKTKNKHEH